MATLNEDIEASYQWIIQAFATLSKPLDFSLESLKFVDEFIDEQSSDGKPKADSILAQQLGTIIFSLGAYVGETIRRQVPGAVWFADDNDPKGEMNIEIRFTNSGRIWPTQKVMKRLRNGPEDSLMIYGKTVVTEYGES